MSSRVADFALRIQTVLNSWPIVKVIHRRALCETARALSRCGPMAVRIHRGMLEPWVDHKRKEGKSSRRIRPGERSAR